MRTIRSTRVPRRTVREYSWSLHRYLERFLLLFTATQSPIVELNAWATRHRVTTRYVLLLEEILPVTSPGLLHRTRSRFSFRLFIGGDVCFDGQGWSHQEARMNCAIAAWTFLSQNSMHLPSPTPAPPAEVQFLSR